MAAEDADESDDASAAKARAKAKAEAASAPDRFGRTPLHEALSKGATHCAAALAAAGADLEAKAWDGGNPLHAGAAGGRGAALEACLEAAAAAAAVSPSSSTPISAALRASDASGKTPAEAAAAAGKREAAEVLRRFEELLRAS